MLSKDLGVSGSASSQAESVCRVLPTILKRHEIRRHIASILVMLHLVCDSQDKQKQIGVLMWSLHLHLQGFPLWQGFCFFSGSRGMACGPPNFTAYSFGFIESPQFWFAEVPEFP